MPLLETQYLPPVQYFTKMVGQAEVHLEACENYRKGSYRNRCHILGPNGVQRLTVPLCSGKNEQQPIREVRISYDQPWRGRHWQAIRSAYGRSPFFEHYAGELELFFTQKKYDLLWDLNWDLLQALLRLLQLNTKLKTTSTYRPEVPPGESDYRNLVRPKKPPADPSFQPVAYPQVFADRHPFQPNLSVLDLLFCTGPEAGRVLRQSAVKS